MLFHFRIRVAGGERKINKNVPKCCPMRMTNEEDEDWREEGIKRDKKRENKNRLVSIRNIFCLNVLAKRRKYCCDYIDKKIRLKVYT